MITLNKMSLILLSGLFIACNSKKEESNSEIKTDTVATTTEKPIEQSSYSKELKLNGISFKIEATGNQLTITPSGLEIDNNPIVRQIEGVVSDAEIGDMSNDNFPELFIYTTIGDSEKRAKVYGYSVNNGKSVSEFTIPNLEENKEAYSGYKGGDEFEIVENTFVRRFPINNDGGTKSKTKQIQYKLVNGEASKKLVVDKVLEF